MAGVSGLRLTVLWWFVGGLFNLLVAFGFGGWFGLDVGGWVVCYLSLSVSLGYMIAFGLLVWF